MNRSTTKRFKKYPVFGGKPTTVEITRTEYR